MSQVEYSRDGEFEMVIAAAAYAITSMDDESLLNKERAAEEMKISDTSKSKGEGNMSKRINSRGSFGWFSNKEEKHDSKSAGDKVTRKSAISDQRMQDYPTVNRKSAEKTKGTTPTIKKATTFTDKHLNDTGSKKFGSGNERTPGQKPYIPKKLSTLSSDTKKKEGNSARSSNKETEADAWEKAEMEKIKKRHEKTKSKILERETKEKTKADLQMEQKLEGIKQRQTKTSKEFTNEISRINEHYARERATADERKRNDELKLREKAKKIRSTGETPHACVCF